MKISIDNIPPRYLNKISQTAPGSRAVQGGKGDRNFDEILISADKRQIGEKQVTEDMARKVMLDVRKNTPKEKIEELKKTVSEGNYYIDADTVASRILLQKGEAIDE